MRYYLRSLEEDCNLKTLRWPSSKWDTIDSWLSSGNWSTLNMPKENQIYDTYVLMIIVYIYKIHVKRKFEIISFQYSDVKYITYQMYMYMWRNVIMKTNLMDFLCKWTARLIFWYITHSLRRAESWRVCLVTVFSIKLLQPSRTELILSVRV